MPDDELDGPLMGNFPNRPDHPDFWALSDIVLRHDGLTEDPGFNMQAHIAGVLDPDSLLYMINQRVRRHLERSVQSRLVTAQALWLDAFMIGVAFAQRETRP